MKPWNRLFSLPKIYTTRRMRFWLTQSFLNFSESTKCPYGKYCRNLVWKTNFQHAVTFQLFLKAFLSKTQKRLFPKEILLFSSLPHRHVNHTLTFENPLVSQSHKTSPDLLCCVLFFFCLRLHWKVHVESGGFFHKRKTRSKLKEVDGVPLHYFSQKFMEKSLQHTFKKKARKITLVL